MSGADPADPAEARARASAAALLGADAAVRGLGITAEGVGAGRATARMRVTAAMINGHGTCHGGYLFTLADAAFALASNTHGEVTVAAGADIAFLSPAHLGDELVAEAVERARQGRRGLYDVTVRRVRDGCVLAEFRGRSRSLGRPLSGPAPVGPA